jgi:hypothetical protein
MASSESVVGSGTPVSYMVEAVQELKPAPSLIIMKHSPRQMAQFFLTYKAVFSPSPRAPLRCAALTTAGGG